MNPAIKKMIVVSVIIIIIDTGAPVAQADLNLPCIGGGP